MDIVGGLLDFGSGHNASPQSYLIGVLQLSAEGYPTGNVTNGYVDALKLAVNEVDGGISFDRWADGHDDFLCVPMFCPFHQGVNIQVGRANAFNWCNDTTQNMVQPTELLRILNGHHVADGFYDANQGLIAAGIPANRANVLIRQIATLRTVLNVLPHRRNGTRKMDTVLRWALYQMQYEAQGCFFSYSGQRGESVNGFFDKFGGELHLESDSQGVR